MKHFVTTLPFAYLVYRFYLRSISTTAQMLFVGLLVMAYIIYNNKYWFSLSRRVSLISSTVFFVLILFVSIIVPVVHGSNDYSYVVMMVGYIYKFLCWIALIIHVLKTASGKDERLSFVNEYCYIVKLYIVFSLVCIAFPSFKALWISLIDVSSHQTLLFQVESYASRMGWDGFAGFGATFSCSLGVFFCLGCLNVGNISSNSKKRIYIDIIWLLLGNVLYGRVGIVASIAVIAIYGLLVFIKKGSAKFILEVSFSVFVFLILINILKERVEIVRTIYEWSFEPFINYLNGKGFTSFSSDQIMDYYVYRMPPLGSLIFGDGYYTQPGSNSYYMHVDPGILRLIYYWGIFPTIAVYLHLIVKVRKSVFGDFWNVLMFIVVVALFEFKGEMCMQATLMIGAIAILNDKKPHTAPSVFESNMNLISLDKNLSRTAGG